MSLDLKRLAMKALPRSACGCLALDGDLCCSMHEVVFQALRAAADEARREEREACATTIDGWIEGQERHAKAKQESAPWSAMAHADFADAGRRLAAAIRRRGEGK